jgi:hypothetical protein
MAAIMVLLRGWVLANVRAWGPAVLDVTRLLDVGDPFARAADFILPGAPAVLAAFEPLSAALADRLGARFSVEAREGWPADRSDVVAR